MTGRRWSRIGTTTRYWSHRGRLVYASSSKGSWLPTARSSPWTLSSIGSPAVLPCGSEPTCRGIKRGANCGLLGPRGAA